MPVALDDAGAAQRTPERMAEVHARSIIEPSGFGKTSSDGEASIATSRNGTSSVAMGIPP